MAAEGEMKASRSLKEAADVLAMTPEALQLRYLQTLQSVSEEMNHTIVFPMPSSLLAAPGAMLRSIAGGQSAEAPTVVESSAHF